MYVGGIPLYAVSVYPCGVHLLVQYAVKNLLSGMIMNMECILLNMVYLCKWFSRQYCIHLLQYAVKPFIWHDLDYGEYTPLYGVPL